MERVVRVFSSHEEAEQAEIAYYRSLTPEQRIEIMLELLEIVWPQEDGTPARLERVYRIAEFPPR